MPSITKKVFGIIRNYTKNSSGFVGTCRNYKEMLGITGLFEIPNIRNPQELAGIITYCSCQESGKYVQHVLPSSDHQRTPPRSSTFGSALVSETVLRLKLLQTRALGRKHIAIRKKSHQTQRLPDQRQLSIHLQTRMHHDSLAGLALSVQQDITHLDLASSQFAFSATKQVLFKRHKRTKRICMQRQVSAMSIVPFLIFRATSASLTPCKASSSSQETPDTRPSRNLFGSFFRCSRCIKRHLARACS